MQELNMLPCAVALGLYDFLLDYAENAVLLDDWVLIADTS